MAQVMLAAALPAACAWRAGDPTWRRSHVTSLDACAVLRCCFIVAVADLMWHWIDQAEQLPARALAAAALGCLVWDTLPVPPLPGSSFVPWLPGLAVFGVSQIWGAEAQSALGLALGRLGGWPLAWAGLCALLSTMALSAWSLWWVRGNHGPIQDGLAPMLSPAGVLPLAVANALGEEVEFRVLLLGALLAGEASASLLWLMAAVVLHAAYFAILHVHRGFPSGWAGGALVFVWAVFLGVLRWWAEGMALVLLLHVQADVVIFLLVLIEERARAKAEAKK